MQLHQAVLAGGCFWCTEAVFQQLDGVVSVISGYTGGAKETADYHSVCTGLTGHAEAIEVKFDPEKISFEQILQVFFLAAHDPTQMNRQGNDTGTQYRSAIFYTTAEQKQIAESVIKDITEQGIYSDPVVTELSPLVEFYPAETHHQNFCNLNPNYPYVLAVAVPKVSKTRNKFTDLLKK